MQGQRRQSQLGLAGGNGLVQQLERVRNDDMLRRAVDKAKPTVASRPAALGSQLPPIGRSSAGAQHAQREAMVQAAMADRMMLLNIAREMSRPASLTTLERKGPSSLNLDKRRRELRRIDSENDKMLRRLEGVKSSYRKSDQSRSYMQSRKHAAIASSNRELHSNLPRYEKRPASHDPRRAERHQEFHDFDMIDEMDYETRMDEHPIGDPDHLPSLPSDARGKPPLWQAKQLASPHPQKIAASSPNISSGRNLSSRPQSPHVLSRAESAASPTPSRALSSRPNSVRGADRPDSGRERISISPQNAPEPLPAQEASDVSQVESPGGAYKWAKAVEARLAGSPPVTSAAPLAVTSELPGSAAAAAASSRSHSPAASEAASPAESPLGFQEMMLASRAGTAPPAEPREASGIAAASTARSSPQPQVATTAVIDAGLGGSGAQHSHHSSPTGSAAHREPSAEPGNSFPKAAAATEHAAAEHSTEDEDALKRIESANSYEEDFDDYDEDEFDEEDDAEESGDDNESVGSRDDRPGSEADADDAEGSQSGRPASASSRGSEKMSAGEAGNDEGESAAASSEPALSPRSEASSVDVPCDEGHEVLSVHSDHE